MKEDNILAEKSLDFAVRTVNCYKFLSQEKKEFVMSKQLYKSGTSIGANIHEGLQAQSKPDFISKMGIALKEASETSYWLNLLVRTEYISQKMFESLLTDCDELSRLLTAIIKSSRENK
ncbi:MAG: four helix bundle protein [Bacteroidales bacterium]|jgi:four helix bundle protein|nr:four helix bundle protein [Bacteroidales bacterium]